MFVECDPNGTQKSLEIIKIEEREKHYMQRETNPKEQKPRQALSYAR